VGQAVAPVEEAPVEAVDQVLVLEQAVAAGLEPVPGRLQD
jgi:hypothetical protein